MGGFVGRDQLVNESPGRVHVESFPLRSSEEGVRGKEDKSGPSLALAPRQLRERQLTVGEWTEAGGVVTNRLGGRFGHSGCVARRGGIERRRQRRRGLRPLAW